MAARRVAGYDPGMKRVALLATFVVFGCREPEAPADLILHNARVYSLRWADPGPDGTPSTDAPWDSTNGWRHDATAVAIRDGRITWVGTDSGALALRGDSTRVVDLQGQVLLPGFVDAHTHVAELGQSLDRVNLTGIATPAEAIEKVVQRAATTAKGEWIFGYGWDEGAWANRYPDKVLLSQRVPDHPVMLRGLHGFATWMNQRALDALGISAATPVPSGGEIRRGADGAPNGLFLNRAVALVDSAIPGPTAVQRDSQVVAALRVMAGAGYTAVHEAGVAGDVVASLQRLDAAGVLPIRVYAMLNGRDSTLLREWSARGPLRRSPSGMLSVRAVKAYYDGALGSRGAQLLEDYSDRAGHRGVSGGAYGFDRGAVAAAMAAGFQVGIHAIGDAGNRATLDFIDSVQRAAPATRGLRHRVEHAQVLHPDDIKRLAALGSIASMQPPHAVEDAPWAGDRLGPDRVRGAYAWRTLRLAGARLAFSSDLPGSDWNIFYGLHSAMTRQDRDGEPDGGWFPEQRMTPEEAVRGYTTWANYAAFDEDESGVITVGRVANLTAITVDPFHAASTQDLLSGRVVLTLSRGRIVYQTP